MDKIDNIFVRWVYLQDFLTDLEYTELFKSMWNNQEVAYKYKLLEFDDYKFYKRKLFNLYINDYKIKIVMVYTKKILKKHLRNGLFFIPAILDEQMVTLDDYIEDSSKQRIKNALSVELDLDKKTIGMIKERNPSDKYIDNLYYTSPCFMDKKSTQYYEVYNQFI